MKLLILVLVFVMLRGPSCSPDHQKNEDSTTHTTPDGVQV